MLKFRCKACKRLFEELTSAADMEKVKCPECGAREAERAYEGKCLFGMTGSSAGRSAACAGSCSGCSGCGAGA
ncbi:MAG: hypothetical protein LBS72_02540 [Oscillospiraceae bacterium]|nr:hypothetical protein [Oscillospiraceae bacterium]